MEYIRQYSSGSSDEDEESDSELVQEEEQPLLITTSTEQGHHDNQKPVIPSTVDSLKPFLQNYLFQQHHMGSVYVYMPWRPSGASSAVLRVLGGQLENHLNSRFADQLRDYHFEKVATNGVNVGYHISLTKNIPGNQRQLDIFRGSIANAFKSFEVDLLAVGPDLDVQAVHLGITKLFGSNIPSANTSKIPSSLQIRFQNTAVLFSSPDYSSLFIGLPVRPSHNGMLHRMRTTIESVLRSAGFSCEDGVCPDSYHLTVSICKNNLSKSITGEVFTQMQQHMSTISLDTSKVCFNTNTINVRTIPSSEPDLAISLRL